MRGTTRRDFLLSSAVASATVLLDRAPAYAQKRELTFLSTNHFVPASDDELRRQAEVFGKQAGLTVKVDTIHGLQLPAKRAAEAQTQSGHDLVLLSHADPFLFENLLVDLGPLVDTLGKKYGGWYPFAAESCQTTSGWRAVPWFWVAFHASNNRFILSGKGSWIHNPISPYNTALANKMPIADDINHHPSPAGPAGIHGAPGINALGIWKFSKNVEPAKELVQFLFRKEHFDAWIVASNAFNQPPLRDLADHPIWVRNPKFAMLPKEAEYAHARGWPSRPNDAVRRVENNYVLPDMVTKAVNGMPTKRAMEWAQDQVMQGVRGQLKAGG